MLKRGILLLLVVMMWAACGGKRTGKKAPPQIQDGIPAGGTLIVGMNGEPEGLNPLTSLSKPARDIMNLIFRRLADINADLSSFSPQLAQSWEWSPDSLSLRFHLRTDVLWHDGHRFSAADVAFTYELQTNPAVAWDGVSYKKYIDAVFAENDSTVVFHFTRRYSDMLMDAVEGFILPQHQLEGIDPEQMMTAEFARKPVGNGPFQFHSWRTQQMIQVVKYSHYYEPGKPHLQRIVFKVVLDATNLFQQLRSGDIDFAEGISPLHYVQLRQAHEKGQTAVRPISYLGRNYDFIGWNLNAVSSYENLQPGQKYSITDLRNELRPHPLFGDQRVRAALTMAIDRETLAEVVNHGMAIPMHGPVPPILWAYREEANRHWPYDPGQARQILAEEGWVDSDGDSVLDKNGVPFRFEMLTNSGNPRREQALTIIQGYLRKVQVDMQPRVVEPGLLLGRLLPAKNYDAILFGWVVGLKMDLAPLFHSTTLPFPFHFTGYYSDRYDIYETLAKEADTQQEARKYWDKAAMTLSHDLPYTWLYYRMECSGLHNRFRDVQFDKRGCLINVKDWWIPLAERTAADNRSLR